MKKLIAEFNNEYTISDAGEVVRVETNSILKAHKNNKGYLMVKVTKFRALLVHRLVAKYFIPNPENKPHVNHKDSNPLNISIENLEWVTHRENMQHAFNQGRIKAPKRIVFKLSANDILRIRERFNSGDSAHEIAKDYKITHDYVYDIRNRRVWKNI